LDSLAFSAPIAKADHSGISKIQQTLIAVVKTFTKLNIVTFVIFIVSSHVRPLVVCRAKLGHGLHSLTTEVERHREWKRTVSAPT
jgi:hypothetical protein